MPTITINYCTTDAGTKEHLLAGLEIGKVRQSITIDDSHESFPIAADMAEVKEDKLIVSIGARQDDVPNVGNMLSVEQARPAA